MTSGINLSRLLLDNDIFRFAGVPCSLLKPITDPLYQQGGARYLVTANEGEAAAVAAGYYLGGKFGVVTMQNSGLGNAVNPLTSLISTFNIPIALLISMRGSFNTYIDEPQHLHMGEITQQLLDLLKIEVFSSGESLEKSFREWATFLLSSKNPSAFLIFREDSISQEISYDSKKGGAKNDFTARSMDKLDSVAFEERGTSTRAQVIEAVLNIISEDDVIVSTTGYTSRELNTICDRQLNFYTVGSMGCASSIALGIAMVSKKRVIVLDGDGAGIMRMGALSTIGMVNPDNLLHLMLDNGAHESTGGQPTASFKTNLGGVAASCGYQNVISTNNLTDLANIFNSKPNGCTFVHFKVKPGVLKNLGRPTIAPFENAIRFRESCS